MNSSKQKCLTLKCPTSHIDVYLTMSLTYLSVIQEQILVVLCDSIIAKLAHNESQLRDPNNTANEKLRSDKKKIIEQQQQLHL